MPTHKPYLYGASFVEIDFKHRTVAQNEHGYFILRHLLSTPPAPPYRAAKAAILFHRHARRAARLFTIAMKRHGERKYNVPPHSVYYDASILRCFLDYFSVSALYDFAHADGPAHDAGREKCRR